MKEKLKSRKQHLAPLQKSVEAHFNTTVGSCTNFPNCPLVFLKTKFYPFVYNKILQRNPIMKSKPKKKKIRSDPFLSHVVGSGEEIKQWWGGRQVAVKAEQISRRRRRKVEMTDWQAHLSILI